MKEVEFPALFMKQLNVQGFEPQRDAKDSISYYFISFLFDSGVPIAAPGARAFQTDYCNVTERKSTQSDALSILIFTLDTMGLEEFRERSTFSATSLAKKWEVAQSIELCHTSHEKATELSRDPTVPFDTATLGFIQLGHILLADNSTGYLELRCNSAL